MGSREQHLPDPPVSSGRGSTAFPPSNGKLVYGPGEDYRDSFREPSRRSERSSSWREPPRVPVYARKRFLWPLAFVLGALGFTAATWMLTPHGRETLHEGIKLTQRVILPHKPSLAESFGAPGTTVLLVGLDHIPSRRGERMQRHSDSIMLASSDFETKQVRLLSIPRDGWATLYHDGKRLGTDKLAHSYAFGQSKNWDDPESGVRCTLQSVERLLELEQPIPYYVVIDPQGFEKVIDAIGGLEIEVDRRMKYRDRRGGLNIDLQPGLQKLNGEQAMGFSRFRNEATGDLARMGRQQKVMRTLLEELKKPQNLPRLPQLFAIFNEHVKTNLSLDQLLALSQHMGDFDSEAVRSITIENYGPKDPEFALGAAQAREWAQYIPPNAISDARAFLSDLAPPTPPTAEDSAEAEPESGGKSIAAGR